ncbi:hypothetical protein AAG906_022782 [Vitis piasezkii]
MEIRNVMEYETVAKEKLPEKKLSKQWDGENAYTADGYPYLLVDDEKGNPGPLP